MPYSTKILLRKNTKSNGKASLLLRVTINRTVKYYKTGAELEPKYWDENKCRVKNSYPLAIKLQKLLDDYENKARNVFFDITNNNHQAINFGQFNALFLSGSGNNFVDLCTKYVNDNKNKLSYNTHRVYISELNKLNKFRANLQCSDISYNLFMDYELYMLGKGNHINTIAKSLKKIRALQNGLIRIGIMKKNDSDNYRIKQIGSSREFLTSDELLLLHEYLGATTNEKLKNVLRYFLFSCYTGLRFQNVEKLRFCDIMNHSVFINDPLAVKNNEIISVPLIDKAIALLPHGVNIDNNAGNKALIFKVVCNQKTNDYLKYIQDITGIAKKLHFHMARHTFATISLNLGIPLEVVQRLLGHKSIKTTQIYAKIVEKTKFIEMQKWNKMD